MLAEQQLRLVVERIIESSIIGAFNDDPLRPATIPTAYDIQNAVDKVMKSVGAPTFSAVKQITTQDSNTSASKFNDNLYTLIDDLTVINNTIISQIYTLTKQFNSTEVEMYKVGNRLRELYAKAQRVLLTNRNTSGFLHSAGRSIILPSNIYLGSGIDVSNGSVKLSSNFAEKLDLTHIRNVNLKLPTSITSINTNTIPADGFDDIADSYWMIAFLMKGYVGPAEVKFEFPLSSDGKVVAIDQLTVETVSGPADMLVELKYTNKYTNNIPLPLQVGGAAITLGGSSSNIAEFMIPSLSVAGDHKISTIELTLSKKVADNVKDGNGEYRFLIKKISAVSSSRETIGSFITTPIEFTSVQNEFSANQLSLSVNHKVFDGCRADYYVGIDPWRAGYLTHNGSEVEWSDGMLSDGISFTEELTTHSGTNGVRASELRRLGITGFTDWEPYWIPILPIESQAQGVSDSGDLHSKVVNLGAYQLNENAALFIADTTPIIQNNISVYDIYEFDTKPSDVTLRQGKHCWIQKQNTKSKYATAQSIEVYFAPITVTGQGSIYSITISPNATPGIGYIRSPGNVIPGSIGNITSVNDNINDVDSNLTTTTDIPTGILSDVQIVYDNGTATLTKNPVTAWDPSIAVKLTYTYLDESQNYSILETNVYVPSNASPYITINEVDGVRKIVISTPDNISISSSITTDGLQDGARIRLVNGWNLIQIYIDTKHVWDPIDNVTLPSQLEWYAYYAPLELVGASTLYNSTYKEDHSRCAIRYDNATSKYYLIVNNPVYPEGTVTGNIYNNDGIVYWNDDDTIIDSADDIFDSAATVDAFYDLSYREIGNYYTHVMLRCDLSGSNNTSPIIYSYEICGGDNLNIVVEV